VLHSSEKWVTGRVIVGLMSAQASWATCSLAVRLAASAICPGVAKKATLLPELRRFDHTK
ncbi:MAG: hypothetical protein WB691_20980, partial [Pseudolabrys sp.]